LSTERLSKVFPVGKRHPQLLRAVDQVSLFVRHQESVGVFGECGSGKSTLNLLLARLDKPSFGRIHFEGRDITRASGGALVRLRRQIQVVFQEPILNPQYSVLDTLLEGWVVQRRGGSAQERQHLARTWLERVGLDANLAERRAGTLSAGEAQLVALASALLLEPRLLLLDSPTSLLPHTRRRHVAALLEELRREREMSTLVFSNDVEFLKHATSRVLVLLGGRIVESGPSHQVLEASAHPYTRALVEQIPAPDPTRRKLRAVWSDGPSVLWGEASGCVFAPHCPRAIPNRCADEPPPLTERDTTSRPSSTNSISMLPRHRLACFSPYEP
jgi:oligopeptide/dipeptide ABC transporter ATP-binding protein